MASTLNYTIRRQRRTDVVGDDHDHLQQSSDDRLRYSRDQRSADSKDIGCRSPIWTATRCTPPATHRRDFFDGHQPIPIRDDPDWELEVTITNPDSTGSRPVSVHLHGHGCVRRLIRATMTLTVN